MSLAASQEPRFLSVRSVEEAIAALRQAEGNGLIVAGGIVVGTLINQGLADPDIIIDISRIDKLRGIEVAPDGDLTIGTLTTHHEMLKSARMARHAPLLTEIARDIACDRLRRRGTLGGSLCTVGGQGDPATGLIALRAKLHLRGPTGTRTVAVEDFYKDTFKVDLEDGEIAEAVQIPKADNPLGFAFCKLAPRSAMDWTQITAAVTLTVADRTISDITIGMNGVASMPIRPRHTEQDLRGRSPPEIDWAEAGATLDGEIAPEGDTVYSETFKRHLARVCLRRAFDRAAARAMGPGGAGQEA